MADERRYLSVSEVMTLTGDSESTVRRLFDDGTLDGFTTERGGHRRITPESVERLLAARERGKMPGEGSDT